MESFDVGAGRTKLTIAYHRWGKDLHVHIGGGEHHIGAVALAGRTPSGQTHLEVVGIPPHKEDRIVEQAARTLQQATGHNVCVTAGIHVPNISKEEIEQILRTAAAGVAHVISTVQPNASD
jgi:hypothetical protein